MSKQADFSIVSNISAFEASFDAVGANIEGKKKNPLRWKASLHPRAGDAAHCFSLRCRHDEKKGRAAGDLVQPVMK